MAPSLREQLADALGSRRYAFVDAGCGEGGSTDQMQRRFGRGRGLGLDAQPDAVTAARASGHDALVCDLLQPGAVLPRGCVAFAGAMDVLEHLPRREDAALVLYKLACAAREFLFIRHPSFEAEDVDYLAGLGLKLNWTDWSCHPNRMSLADFRALFTSSDWRDFVILPHMPYTDSGHPSLLPLGAPEDSLRYDAALHGPKPQVRFDRPVYGKYDIFVRLRPLAAGQWERIASVAGWEARWDL